MPRSRRDKIYNLSKKTKTGRRSAKNKLIQEIRDCCKMYSHVFIFTVHNEKNITLKKLRRHWGGSRLFLGKNKLMMIALGITTETSCQRKIHFLSKRIKGNCGLMFTDSSKDDVIKYFSNFRELHFARPGFKATKKFTIPEGPLENCPPQMEPRLRKLGLRTKLNKGIVELTEPTIVCEKHDLLSTQQAQILELFEVKMAEFYLEILAVWKKGETKEDNVYEDIVPPIVDPLDCLDDEGDEGDDEEKDSSKLKLDEDMFD